jgi:hypothetical protein
MDSTNTFDRSTKQKRETGSRSQNENATFNDEFEIKREMLVNYYISDIYIEESRNLE